jgi:antitoxin component of RelBE/YafQ-DinJ toxin-antitoxin module
MTAETLTIRIDGEIKRAAKERAEGLGLSLSAVLTNQLRRFINGAPVIIDDDSLVPSAATRTARATAIADYRAGNVTVLANAADIATYDPEPHG